MKKIALSTTPSSSFTTSSPPPFITITIFPSSFPSKLHLTMFFKNHLLLLFIFCFINPSCSSSTSACNRFCGQKHVSYPFGFSPECEISLNCRSKGEIFIGEFQVLNVTRDNLLLSLPAACNRSISTLTQLFSRNYAVTAQNELVLGNCKNQTHVPTSSSDCKIVSNMIQPRVGCKNMNRSCFSSEEIVGGVGTKGLFSWGNVSERSCEWLLSSVSVYGSRNGSRLAVESETIELGWWLEGGCKCSANADCVRIGGTDFRCACKEGFVGDGFSSGRGCRKVSSKCHPSKYMSGRCGGTNRVGVLIGGIVVGASLMSVLALLCYLIRRKSSSLKSQRSTKRLLTETAGRCSVPFFTYREIERATNGFSEKNRLGTGAYGTVYAGKMHNDEWVAIKKIKHRDADGIEQVMNEIKLLSSVNHPNLVRLLGYCIERGEQVLVYEFMPNGTLSQHLQRERGTVLPWTIRLTIAHETAQAIAHLHSAKNPPIYHRDIKSSNILLDESFKSKVADFGLSRLGMMTETSHISTAPQGTPGYLDPQYHQSFHLSDKSDVYSFGVVLVEIITALKVVDFSRPHCQVNLAALAVDKIGKGCVDDIIDPLLEPHRDAWTLSSVHKVAELAFRCLAFHRDMRPSMMEVAAELENIMQSAWAPAEDQLLIRSSGTSPSNLSDRSHTTNKVGLESSRRLILQQRSICMITLGEVKDSSPVSVQEPWFSEQSSPSSNSLLDNVIN